MSLEIEQSPEMKKILSVTRVDDDLCTKLSKLADEHQLILRDLNDSSSLKIETIHTSVKNLLRESISNELSWSAAIGQYVNRRYPYPIPKFDFNI